MSFLLGESEPLPSPNSLILHFDLCSFQDCPDTQPATFTPTSYCGTFSLFLQRDLATALLLLPKAQKRDGGSRART